MALLRILKPKKNKFSEELITQTVNFENDELLMEDSTEENEDDVLSFKVDYLGCFQIHTMQEFNPENALKLLKLEMEVKKRKAQKGVILIFRKSIKLTDMRKKEIFKIPILRISSCSMDPFNKKVFFFIDGHQNSSKIYHAFLCEKWKNAYNAAQAIAHMFGQSHENYIRDIQNKKFFGIVVNKENTSGNVEQRYSQDMMDFSVDSSSNISEKDGVFKKNWISFED